MIKPAKQNPKPRDLVTYDLEWHPETYELRLIGTYDGNQYRSYRTVEEFLSAGLIRSKRGAWYVAHAGGSFDIQFIIDGIRRSPNRKDYSVECNFSGSSANCVTVRNLSSGCKWEFIDSFLLLKDKLENIAKWIGMAKGGDSAAERMAIFTGNLRDLEEYNELDCRILYNALRGLERNLIECGGRLQRTLASSALYLFRAKYLKRTITTSAADNAWMRAGYVASRVEVFRKEWDGPDPLLYYDINSSFPYSMLEPQPGKLISIGRNFPVSSNTIYFADATVNIPEIDIPPLPVRKGGRVFYPVGDIRLRLSGTDLRLLEECGGRILKIHEVHSYESFSDLGGYVTALYDLKQKAPDDSLERETWKGLLNSLYGKFGEQEEKDRLCFGSAPEGYADLGDDMYSGTVVKEIEHTHVPISANVTSLSRALLTRYLWKAIMVCYADTDSVLTPSRLPTGKGLGELKLVKEKDGRSLFISPKFYSVGEEVRAKGFRKLSYPEFLRIVDGWEIYKEKVWRIRELARSGDTTPRKSIQGKKLNNPFPKRCFNPDGTSRPWRIEEIPDA